MKDPEHENDRDPEREREIDDLLSGRSGGSERKGDDASGRPASGRPALSGRQPAGSEERAGPTGPEARPVQSSHSGRRERSSAEREEGEGRKVRLPFNYGALVGLIFVLIVAVAVVNLLTSQESGTVGIGDVGIGEKVAPFAVPIAASELEGDANIDPDEACDVPGKDVLRICDYFDRPTVISFWFTTGASACIDQQDVFEKVARRFKGRVNTVSINVRDDRERVRELIEQHGWKVPVGHDTDGAVSNIYRVGGCPTFLFLTPGGMLERAEIGRTTVRELSSQVRSFADGQ